MKTDTSEKLFKPCVDDPDFKRGLADRVFGATYKASPRDGGPRARGALTPPPRGASILVHRGATPSTRGCDAVGFVACRRQKGGRSARWSVLGTLRALGFGRVCRHLGGAGLSFSAFLEESHGS